MTDLFLPSSPEAERFCLGSVLLDNSKLHTLRPLMVTDDFTTEANRQIWESIALVYDSGQPVDRLTVYNDLARRKRAEAAGGLTYLVGLDDGLPNLDNIDGYVQVVKDKTALRALITACDAISKRAQHGSESVDVLLQAAREQISGVTVEREQKDPMWIKDLIGNKSLDEILTAFRGQGIPYPWRDLEYQLCGMRAGQMIVIAANTSFGKTSMALQIATHAAKAGKGVVIFSREMEKDRLLRRMINQIAQVDSDKLRHDALSTEERERRRYAATSLADTGLYLDEQSSTVPAIKAAIRRVKNAAAVDLVIVDYLQLLQAFGRPENRTKEVAANSRALKSAAIELGVPFVVLSQFSRDNAKAGRDPELYDLKETGDLENDADVVLLIRPEKTGTGDPNYIPVKIRIAKQREGPRNIDVDMIFRPNFQRFESAERSAA